jgi:uncharacterized protein YprB with RNaseH-like and TPR domain
MTAWPAPQAVAQPYWWPLPPIGGAPQPLDALVEGNVVQTAHGAFFRRRAVFPADHAYGETRLGDFLALDPQSAAALARTPELADVPLEQVLFLDTETTGLAGGTGTHAFLVGLGYFAEGGSAFVLDQCFMRSFGEERAMLSWIAAHLEEYAVLATFNGKTFDVPLLQTRFLMSRLRIDLEEFLQFDLLAPARRLWKAAVQSCALQSLERHVLGVGRHDDVESFLIPAIYYQYLRDGDARYVARVFNHNQADILALVAVAVRACAALDACRDGSERRPALTPAEYAGLARIYEQLGNDEAAERAYNHALAGPLPLDVRCRTLLALAALCKRTGRHDTAAALWQSLADEAPAHSVVALVELAKYWEHRRRDPARAHEVALLARDRWQAHLPAAERLLPGLSRYGAAAPTPAPPDDFARRLARLAQKRERRSVRG